MKNLFFCFLAIFAICMAPAFAQVKPEDFLLRFGYLKDKTGPGRSDTTTPEQLEQAILQFQSFNGLPQTGVMDGETSKKMTSPRCGVKDKTGDDELAEYKLVSKWRKNILTWKVNKYSRTSRLSPAEQKGAISRGLHRWSEVTPLIFKETGGKPNIDISFERLNHNDGYPFYWGGKVLAHAFFPPIGDTHFDDDKHWVNGNMPGVDLETVAAHEFGHALGLGHSNNPSSLMAPYYQKFPDGFKLHPDDVAGIQRLYGKTPVQVTPTTDATTTTTTRGTPPTTPTPPRSIGFCLLSYQSIDAAMRIFDDYFVFVDNNTVIDGRYGKKRDIQRLFPGGPKAVQAAVYSEQNRRAYLFKDDHIWAFLFEWGSFELVANFPKQLSNYRVHKPESAVSFDYYGIERIYLIKNGYFVEFRHNSENVAPGKGYVAGEFFPNIPRKIDAAIYTNDAVHFIVNNKAYTTPEKSRIVSRQGKPLTTAFRKCKY